LLELPPPLLLLLLLLLLLVAYQPSQSLARQCLGRCCCC
jgi:hypothetical protein